MSTCAITGCPHQDLHEVDGLQYCGNHWGRALEARQCAQSALGQQQSTPGQTRCAHCKGTFLQPTMFRCNDGEVRCMRCAKAFQNGPGQQQAAGGQLGSAQALAVQHDLAMARLPLSVRYDSVEADNARLRARVAELESGHTAEDGSWLTRQQVRAAQEHTAMLQARVAELEAAAVKPDAELTWEHEQQAKILLEDLRRKREECERLECYASDLRQTAERLGHERDDARRELGATHAENARLRRELGRRKP